MTTTEMKSTATGQASPKQLAGQMGLICLLVISQFPLPLAAELDMDSRWMIRDFYRTVYFYGSEADMGWTGDYSKTGAGQEAEAAGTVSADWLDATLVRINFYREMGGVPANITFDEALNAKCQLSAIIQSANGYLSHTPPSNSPFFTQDGYDASYHGNLAIGSAGAEAVTGYMVDHGSAQYPESNNRVGHRRWILFPATEVMGSGGVPGNESYWEANCIWVQDKFTPRPETRTDWVAWPPAGHVPSSLVWSRWSISHPDADFNSSSVSMMHNGVSIPLIIEYVSAGPGYPEPTLVWVPNSMDTTQRQDWPTPDEDEEIQVTVSDVWLGGQYQDISYTVTIFDADQPGQDESATTLTPPSLVEQNIPATFTITTRPGWSEAVDGRIHDAQPMNATYGAEGAENPFITAIYNGYEIIQTHRSASGSAAFQLVHHANVVPDIQLATLPDSYIIGENAPALTFQSSLSYVGSGQVAAVDINLGDGGTWEPIWEVSQAVDQQVTSFTEVNIPLDEFAGSTARFRFRFDFVGGSYYPYGAPPPAIGWAFDDISMVDVQRITSTTYLDPVAGNRLEATLTTPDTVYLQAREYAFGGFPMEWGPVLAVTPGVPNGYPVALGEWSDDALFGMVYGYADGWLYSSGMGFLWMDAYPWIYSPLGWMLHLQGNIDSGLWLYHLDHGFIHAREDYEQGFYHSPFGEDDWMRFWP